MKTLTVFKAYQKAVAGLQMDKDSIQRFETGTWSTDYTTSQVTAMYDRRDRRSRQVQRFEAWLECRLYVVDRIINMHNEENKHGSN